MMTDYKAGATLTDIATKYGYNRIGISSALKAAGVRVRRAALTEEQAGEAERLYAAGQSLATLAARFDVDASTIRTRLLKQAWPCGRRRTAGDSWRMPYANGPSFVGAACDACVMGNATALDYWTLAIALVGGATGLAALVTQVWGLILSGPRVKVTVANALLTRNGAWALSLDVSNIGRLPVTLLEMGVTFRANGEWQKVPLAAMPPDSWDGPEATHRLPDGEAVTWVLEPGIVAHGVAQRGAAEVHGYVRLATGKVIRSRKAIDVVNLASLH